MSSLSCSFVVFCLSLLCRCQDEEYAPKRRKFVALVGGSCSILLGVLVEERSSDVAGGDGNESENVRRVQAKRKIKLCCFRFKI